MRALFATSHRYESISCTKKINSNQKNLLPRNEKQAMIIGSLLGSMALCFAIVFAPFIAFKLSSHWLKRRADIAGDSEKATTVKLLAGAKATDESN